MNRSTTTGCAVGMLMLLAGCAPAPPPAPPDTRATDEKTIRDGEVAWVNEWAGKDIEKILSHYADDATLMAPGFPEMKGKNAIRAGLTELLKDPNLSMKFMASSAQVSKSGDLAYTQGAYTMVQTDTKTKKPVTEKGTYVTIYKKEVDGSWKAVEDIAAPGAPEAPPPRAK